MLVDLLRSTAYRVLYADGAGGRQRDNGDVVDPGASPSFGVPGDA